MRKRSTDDSFDGHLSPVLFCPSAGEGIAVERQVLDTKLHHAGFRLVVPVPAHRAGSVQVELDVDIHIVLILASADSHVLFGFELEIYARFSTIELAEPG